MYVGVDCGATHTKVSVFDSSGNRLARFVCGPGNPTAAPLKDVELNIVTCLEKAKESTGAEKFDLVAFSTAGLSYTGPQFYADIVRKRDLGERVAVFEDFVVAHYACFRGSSGIAYIAGTGSSIYGIDEEGLCVKIGGWGHLVGDEGSGFYVGREGIRVALMCIDTRGPPTSLCLRLFEHLGIESVSEIVSRIYGASSPKELIAGFARIVVEEARRGDDVAFAILEDAAHEIVRGLIAAYRAINVKRFCITGGFYSSARDLLKPLIERELAKEIEEFELVDPCMDLERAVVELALRVSENGKPLLPQ